MRGKLDFIDNSILRFLFLRGWVSSNHVADSLKIAWITADIHLKKLHKLGYVVKGKSEGGSVYWRANT